MIDSVIDNISDLIQRRCYIVALKEIAQIEKGPPGSLSDVDAGRLHLLAAESCHFTGQYRDGLSRASQAVEIFRLNDPSGLYGRAKYIRGLIRLDLGEYLDALDDFNESAFVSRRKNDAEGELKAINCMARCSYMQGHFERAKEHLERTLELSKILNDPLRYRAMQGNLGRVLYFLGDFEGAKSCLEINPDVITAMPPLNRCSRYASLGYLMILVREFKKATNYLNESLEIAKQHSFARELALYYEFYGELAFWRGNYKQAEKHLCQAIEIGSDIAPEGDLISQSFRLLAELQIELNQLDAAEESCTRAWTIAEKIVERLEMGAIQRARGEIYARQGQVQIAREHFDDAIERLDFIGAKYELARAHLQAGETEIFDLPYRRKNLIAAAALFDKVSVLYWQERTADSIDKLIRTENTSLVIKRSRSSVEKPGAPFIAVSAPMQKILARVEQIKDTDATILLLGETGVGKDRLAEYIHHISNRAEKPFESICVTAIAPQLWESELFGHAQGAFTGAGKRRIGRLERANGGTVYLNEISEITPDLQAKFLEVLEHKRIQPVGSSQPMALDVRFIAASNRDLKQEMDAGRFREDLFYRLNRVCIDLPPLRERYMDMKELAAHFLQRYKFPPHKAGRLLSDQSFIALLHDHEWPGNVRQLDNVIWQLAQCANGAGLDRLVELARDILAREKLLPNPDREKLIASLKSNDWNKSKTARAMGISEGTVRKWMKDFGINRHASH